MFQTLLNFLADNLLDIMIGCFSAALVVRMILLYSIKRQSWFAKEFEKRVFQGLSYISSRSDSHEHGFFTISKMIFQQTYKEIFDLRTTFARRKHDKVMSIGDRIFLVQEGCAQFIMDFLRSARYLKKEGTHQPSFLDMSKHAVSSNPVFGKLFAIFPVGHINNILNMLPSMFIVFGIFGTFLGIMRALPDLGGMDVTDVESSKAIMDAFLLKISFAMNTSILGIVLSVVMGIVNSIFSPDGVFIDSINRLTSSLELLWNSCEHNEISQEEVKFIEVRDAVDIDSDHVLKLDGKISWEDILLSDRQVEDPDAEKAG